MTPRHTHFAARMARPACGVSVGPGGPAGTRGGYRSASPGKQAVLCTGGERLGAVPPGYAVLSGGGMRHGPGDTAR